MINYFGDIGIGEDCTGEICYRRKWTKSYVNTNKDKARENIYMSYHPHINLHLVLDNLTFS